MRVLALVPSQKGHSPGQRGSIELWESVLADNGIEVVYAPFETEKLREILYLSGRQMTKASEMIKAYADRLKLLRTLDDFDAVFVYREAALLGPAFLEKRIAKRKPIIYQLDDPLFVPYRSPSNGYLSYLKFFGKVKEIIKISRVVMVNSTHIREFAAQYNSNIWQVPSIVDTNKFIYRPFETTGRICVGWSGSPTTLKNIRMIEGPLQELSSADVCDLHFIGGEDFGLRDVNYTAQKWNSETEVEDLRKMQIGLVPLPENPWNKYKFIMKTAQYMALGIVPIGTPMASNPEVIMHGENGFLAESDDDWLRCVRTLVSDHELRARMSARAADDARTKYSLEANSEKVISAFRAAVN
jgi:glycosyltransferase involved in cell wall biosynthesis